MSDLDRFEELERQLRQKPRPTTAQLLAEHPGQDAHVEQAVEVAPVEVRPMIVIDHQQQPKTVANGSRIEALAIAFNRIKPWTRK